MHLCTGIAPQNFAHPTGFAPMAQGFGGANLIMLQQQLMMAMASLFSGFSQNSFAANSPLGGGALPSMANFGGGGFGGGARVQSGLDSFLGGASGRPGAAHKGGTSRRPKSSGVRGDNKFTTLNVNIKSRPLMSQQAVRHDVQKAARNADLIGWNEIAPDRYRQAIRDLGPEWGHFMPKDGNYKISNPISYRKDEWKFLDGDAEKTHDGKAGICPARYITWAKLKHKGSNEKIVRINTHLVSGAFNKTSSHNAWRRASWNTHMKKLSAMVKKFEGQGFKVVVAGDFNKNKSKVLGNQLAYDTKFNQATHDGGSTLDYLMHSKNNGLKNLNGGVLGGFRSDHNAVRGTYRL